MTGEATPAKNTNRELWREGAQDNDYYANSIHVTETGGIGINCGGFVIVKRLNEWHALAEAALSFAHANYAKPLKPRRRIDDAETTVGRE